MSDLEEFRQVYGLTSEQASEFAKLKLKCKCGNFRKLKPSSQSTAGVVLSIYCGNKGCHPRYGIKRPEHAELMKKKAASDSKFKETLIKKGELRNPTINTPEFQNKIVKKSGIFSSYSELISNRVRSTDFRRKQLITRLPNWEPQYLVLFKELVGKIPTAEDAMQLADADLLELWKISNSINTFRNLENTQTSRSGRWFKSDLLSGFKFNSSGAVTVRTRSGLETYYISLFEKEGVLWEYETVRIPTKDKKGFYLPDFLIEYNGKKYLIEVKGSFYNQPDLYISNKLAAGYEYAAQHNWTFCLVRKEYKDMSFLSKTIYGV